MRELWRTLDGYSTTNWTIFKASLTSIYPDTSAAMRYTKKTLQDFIDASARDRIRDEDDVIAYYRRFLETSNHLYSSGELTDDKRNSEFFQGFHPDDQEVLANRLFSMNPKHPTDKPYAFKDILNAARTYFANKQFYRPAHRQFRSSHDNGDDLYRNHSTPDYRIRQRSDNQDTHHHAIDRRGHDQDTDRCPNRESKAGRSMDQSSKPVQDDEDKVLSEIITGMVGLSTCDSAYTILYAKCKHCFPEIAKSLPTPELFRSTMAVMYQAPAMQQQVAMQLPERAPIAMHQPWPQPAAQSTDLDTEGTFFCEMRTDGCAFCAKPGHRVRGCPTAQEYIRTGRAVIKNDRICLPTGHPIPNDGSRRGLKHGIDTWLAASSATTGELLATISQPQITTTLQRDPPPHIALALEIVPDNRDNEESDDSSNKEIYNMYEVLAAEQKKHDTRPSKLPEATPQPNATTSTAAPVTRPPGISNSRSMQY